MSIRFRFVIAYGALALGLVASGTATWRLLPAHRAGPLAPGAVDLVDHFLAAVQRGDLKTACGMFSALPACARRNDAPPLVKYEVFPAEAAVDGVDVPATLDGNYALFAIVPRARGRGYRIVDVIADPSALSGAVSARLAA